MSQTLILKQKPKMVCVFRVKRTTQGTEVYIKSPLAEKIFVQKLRASIIYDRRYTDWNGKNFYDYTIINNKYRDYFQPRRDGLFVKYREHEKIPNLMLLACVGIGNGITIKFPYPINVEAIRHFEKLFAKAATDFLNHYKAGLI